MATAQPMPARFPIFPLRGALLLPGGNLPLNIFEPRYLAMVKDAMQADRVIGMIQPRGDGDGTSATPLFGTGCAGRINDLAETEDGRLLLTLTGLQRFDVTEELTVTTPYRQVAASFDRWGADLEPEEPPAALKAKLLGVLEGYFRRHGIEAEPGSLERAPLPALVVSLAMVCPFAAAEKQALLEAPTVARQGDLLVALMEMGALDATPAGADRGRLN